MKVQRISPETHGSQTYGPRMLRCPDVRGVQLQTSDKEMNGLIQVRQAEAALGASTVLHSVLTARPLILELVAGNLLTMAKMAMKDAYAPLVGMEWWTTAVLRTTAVAPQPPAAAATVRGEIRAAIFGGPMRR